MLEKSYDFYSKATDVRWSDDVYCLEEDNEELLTKCLSKCKVMVITANPIEKAMLHYCMHEKTHEKIIRIIHETVVYYIFKWGNYKVVHIHQPQTGGFKDFGLSVTVSEALRYSKPNVILSLGVAFGIDCNTQKM